CARVGDGDATTLTGFDFW
nr:immunoglobulin heavy chain junction region [Macaca mulatta]MOV55199.1 immunoglobulin heavy chain junction region [Macaca mulatta]MOV55358.1 immunoglobulin heavy chain junction region [Macaca mulatta]MOV55459.1 immunoglobulin heavy chain junction region [Macaca mulatta]MOV55470.1 immunoglobulin heavy chain junction region [Macaca mulatta]